MLSELAKHDISLDDLNIFLELGSVEAVMGAVAAGYGVSFVSRVATAHKRKHNELIEVPVDGIDLNRIIYIVRKEIDSPNRSQEVFWSFIHDPENADLLKTPGSP